MNNSTILISGNRESGKTSLCLEIVKIVHEYGLSISGLVSPKNFDSGKADVIFCVDIMSGEKIQLAVWEPGWDLLNPAREWKINPSAAEWGNDRLARIFKTDILIVDELGYQEFEQNTGWMNAFKIIGSEEIKISIVVVRPSLIHKAKDQWPGAVELNLDRESVEEIMNKIENILLKVAKVKKRNPDCGRDIE